MSKLVRREIPMLISSFVISICFIDYYIKNDFIKMISITTIDWAVIISAIALGIGVIGVFQRNIITIKNKKPYWYIDAWMIIVILITTATGFIIRYGQDSSFKWIMNNVFISLEGSIYGMAGLSISSALYRAFRIKSIESGILLIITLLIMIGMTPITAVYFPQLISISDWLNNVPATSGNSILIIMAALGLLGFTIRTLLWHEKVTVGVID